MGATVVGQKHSIISWLVLSMLDRPTDSSLANLGTIVGRAKLGVMSFLRRCLGTELESLIAAATTFTTEFPLIVFEPNPQA